MTTLCDTRRCRVSQVAFHLPQGNDVRTAETPTTVERVAADIDEIVHLAFFPGRQDTLAGEREIKKALRKLLFKSTLHEDEKLFEKAYRYIRQYY